MMTSFFLIFTIDDSSDSCDRNREDDTEDATECRTHHHDDEYEKWREIQCLAHHIGYKSIILYTLDDEIEDRDEYSYFPGYTESYDDCRDEGKEWSDIGDELHDTSDESEGEFFL